MEDTTGERVRGLVLRRHAWFYDWAVRLMTARAGRSYTTALLRQARLRPGESVLDLGCGTGTLALGAAALVGEQGRVIGIDASEQMLNRARRKQAGARVQFLRGTVEALPFASGTCDVVFSTLMLHHLPSSAREACLQEARRVLRPGGRLVACDFETTSSNAKGFLGRLHRHGGLPAEQMAKLIEAAGFQIATTAPLGVMDLHFILAFAP